MKQTTKKFDKWDRERVIDTVEKHYGVKLEKIGKRDKWLRDESGRNWWVLGGVDGWHGISEEMMEDEKQAQLEGMLVVAEKNSHVIKVFVGRLSELVRSRDKLSRTATRRDYQFTVEVREDRMQCTQAPDVVLERIAFIRHSEEDREQVRRRDELKKAIARLSPKERKEFLEKHRINEATPT